LNSFGVACSFGKSWLVCVLQLLGGGESKASEHKNFSGNDAGKACVDVEFPRFVDVGKLDPVSLQRAIADYMNQDRDLIFSTKFSPEVKTRICKAGTEQGFAVSHCGTGNAFEKYIVLCKFTAISELVKHILASGGETPSYILIPPKGMPCVFTDCWALLQASHMLMFIDGPGRIQTCELRICQFSNGINAYS